MKIVKRALVGIAIMVVVVLLLLVAEVVVNNHDRAKSALTRPGAMREEGGAAKQGLNRRKFQEIRFRARGLRVYLIARQIGIQEAQIIPESVHGRITASSRDIVFSEFDFRLVEVETKGVEIEDPERKSAEPSGGVEIFRRVDQAWAIMPATENDRAAHDRLAEYAFEENEAVILDITLNGPVPRTASFVFAFSRAPKSVLYGTLLEPLARRALALAHGKSSEKK